MGEGEPRTEVGIVSWPTCACGCGGRVPAIQRSAPNRGYVKGQPHKYISGHQHKKFGDTGFTVLESGCWEWRHAGGAGYGTIRVEGKSVNAHRWLYENRNGKLERGLDLHHTCENRRCVNPDHLVAVSRSEHIRLHRSKAAA